MVQGMTEAEAKRQQQRRALDAEHLRSIGTKLTPVELARLDAYCFWIRTTRYSLLRTHWSSKSSQRMNGRTA